MYSEEEKVGLLKRERERGGGGGGGVTGPETLFLYFPTNVEMHHSASFVVVFLTYQVMSGGCKHCLELVPLQNMKWNFKFGFSMFKI